MKNLLYTMVCALFISSGTFAQDAVICGADGTGGDEFTFVLTRDFVGGEYIYITEDEYSDVANSFSVSEGHIRYTVPPGGLFKNEVVFITESGPDTYTVGTAGGMAEHVGGTGPWSFSFSDELYIYSASNPSSPWNSITAIHCFYWSSRILPLTDQKVDMDWPNAITIDFNIGGAEGTNADFMDPARMFTTRAAIQDGANWFQSTGDMMLSQTDFINQMLPVQLKSIEVILNNDHVDLVWVTASEIDNDYFDIEHGTDGRRFAVLGTVEGMGTTSTTSSYQFQHEIPEIGNNYYRLRQVDFNGKFAYSQIVSVAYRSDHSTVNIYPNPFDKTVTLQFLSADGFRENNQIIVVFNIYGNLVHQESLTDGNAILDLSGLIPGAYFLQARKVSGKLVTQRIVKY